MGNLPSTHSTVRTSFDNRTKITKCTWTIEPEFVNKFKQTQNGYGTKSDYFSTDQNLEWFISGYPNGSKKEQIGHCIVGIGLKSLAYKLIEEYKSITVYFYIRSVQTHACIERIYEFTKNGEEWGWPARVLLLSELSKHLNLSFEIGIRILKIRYTNESLKYRYDLHLSKIHKNASCSLKWHINETLFNTFKNAHFGKGISGRLLSDINPMFSIDCRPNGLNEENKGYVLLYLRVLTFPSHIESMTIKFTLKCLKLNESKTKQYTFNEKEYYNGWPMYCESDKLKSLSSLDIICDIQILELCYEKDNFEKENESKLNSETENYKKYSTNLIQNNSEMNKQALMHKAETDLF